METLQYQQQYDAALAPLGRRVGKFHFTPVDYPTDHNFFYTELNASKRFIEVYQNDNTFLTGVDYTLINNIFCLNLLAYNAPNHIKAFEEARHSLYDIPLQSGLIRAVSKEDIRDFI